MATPAGLPTEQPALDGARVLPPARAPAHCSHTWPSLLISSPGLLSLVRLTTAYPVQTASQALLWALGIEQCTKIKFLPLRSSHFNGGEMGSDPVNTYIFSAGEH